MTGSTAPAVEARHVYVRGVVQGVGFRPFTYRLAQRLGVRGWVANAGDGVEAHVEGAVERLEEFIRQLREDAPPMARVEQVQVASSAVQGIPDFRIRESVTSAQPSVYVSPDLPACAACLEEVHSPGDRRWRYPYTNCADCGPRYSVIESLPYDRARTTMAAWPLCAECREQFQDPGDRRFQAQPVACPACGPGYRLMTAPLDVAVRGWLAIEAAAEMIRRGQIIAVKGLGGYHLVCDAFDERAVNTLRERKYRKHKPFALMARDTETASALVVLDTASVTLLSSPARPIVLAPRRVALPGVAPAHGELGVMIPYTPLHHLLFDAGAPSVLVMTSGNRSSEPIAYTEEDAISRLSGIADAFLVGERGIARSVEDSVVRPSPHGPVIVRRARGYAPGIVARFPSTTPVLAVGGDLKNAVTLAVDGQAIAGAHTGDLEHHDARVAFHAAIRDLLAMYGIDQRQLIVAHDQHPQYASTDAALRLDAKRHVAVQHHRAHVASVLAEHGDLDRSVLGVAFDGTGYGDDGSIWGGELFAGSAKRGFVRVAHLRDATLVGGDSASRWPPQAAAGFVRELEEASDLTSAPFHFGERYVQARGLAERGVRTLPTTSVGRLFDAMAAILGFTAPVTYEGEAAIWLENLARNGSDTTSLSMPYFNSQLDFRPVLSGALAARRRGADPADVARAFHVALARGTAEAVRTLCDAQGLTTVVLSGGVFQNQQLLGLLRDDVESHGLEVWINQSVPANDGGISLGQAVIASMVG